MVVAVTLVNSIANDDHDCRQTYVPAMTSSSTHRTGRGQQCHDNNEVAERTATTLRTRRYATNGLHRQANSGRIADDRDDFSRRTARLVGAHGSQRRHAPDDRLSYDGGDDQSTSQIVAKALRSDSGAVILTQRHSGGRRQVQAVNTGLYRPTKRRIVDGTSQCIQTYCSLSAPVLDRFACILRFCNRATRRSLTMTRVISGAR